MPAREAGSWLGGPQRLPGFGGEVRHLQPEVGILGGELGDPVGLGLLGLERIEVGVEAVEHALLIVEPPHASPRTMR